MIQVEPLTYVFAAMLLLTLPLNWLAAAFFSALFHEMCHILALRLSGSRIKRVRIGSGGAEIEAEFVSREQELLCAMAGPAGSLLLLIFYKVFPRLALCGAVQGFFNLLPIYPMDGGRILGCILGIFLPQREEYVRELAEKLVCSMLLLLTAVVSLKYSLGILPITVMILFLLKAFLRKIPCKHRQIRVQ